MWVGWGWGGGVSLAAAVTHGPARAQAVGPPATPARRARPGSCPVRVPLSSFSSLRTHARQTETCACVQARDASKPGRGTPLHTPDGQEELWVAVSTSALAAAAKSQGAAEAALVAELGELFAPHCTGGVVPTPTRVAST